MEGKRQRLQTTDRQKPLMQHLLLSSGTRTSETPANTDVSGYKCGITQLCCNHPTNHARKLNFNLLRAALQVSGELGKGSGAGTSDILVNRRQRFSALCPLQARTTPRATFGLRTGDERSQAQVKRTRHLVFPGTALPGRQPLGAESQGPFPEAGTFVGSFPHSCSGRLMGTNILLANSSSVRWR